MILRAWARVAAYASWSVVMSWTVSVIGNPLVVGDPREGGRRRPSPGHSWDARRRSGHPAWSISDRGVSGESLPCARTRRAGRRASVGPGPGPARSAGPGYPGPDVARCGRPLPGHARGRDAVTAAANDVVVRCS